MFVIEDFEGELIDSPEGELAWIDDEKVFDLPLWEGDRIFIPWLDEEGFFSAKFEYQGERLERHSVRWYGRGG